MTQGINGESILMHLPGFSWTQSCLHDGMHLLWENLVLRLVELWTCTGRFKKLNAGKYKINTLTWEKIGDETALATATIPSVFCRALPNMQKSDIYSLQKHGPSGLSTLPFICSEADSLTNTIHIYFSLSTLSRSACSLL